MSQTSSDAAASPVSPAWAHQKYWILAFCLMIGFIWGNSLVPGQESGTISGAVVDFLQHALADIGLPSDWVTQFVVRKTAHFSEYLLLGVIAMQAFAPHRAPRTWLRAVVCALAIVAVPCCDETIQLFVSERAGQVTDVLIDCSGAATGVLLTLLVSWLRSRRANKKAAPDTAA